MASNAERAAYTEEELLHIPDQDAVPEGAVLLPRDWRSVTTEMLFFIITGEIAVLSQGALPFLDLELPIGPWVLVVPLLTLIPFAILLRMLYLIYESDNFILPDSVLVISGKIGLTRKLTRFSYDQIFGVEVRQNIIDRLFDVGDIRIGSSLTGKAELKILGIVHPKTYASKIESNILKAAKNLQHGSLGLLLRD